MKLGSRAVIEKLSNLPLEEAKEWVENNISHEDSYMWSSDAHFYLRNRENQETAEWNQ